jgi:predicted metal-dependent hydrolase
MHQIVVGGVQVQVVRKGIKNLHLGVYPPNGRVRVAAPLRLSDNAVRLAVVGKLGWIKRQRSKFEAQPRQSSREMVSGESHYVLGRRYRLNVVYVEGVPKVTVRGRKIVLQVRPGSSRDERLQVLQRWNRLRLREKTEPLLEAWQKKMRVEVADWSIRRMKTRWGGCNPRTRRIWLNLELAKKPVRCLEYVVVHELAHLIEPLHSPEFLSVMDRHLPDWRARRALLNAQPLAHDLWQ